MSAGKETTDEIGAAFWAEPNVTGVVAAPILGPYGRNQLSIAVNATHQHGDPSQSPRNPQRLSASNHVKTKDNLRPPLMCGLNQWIGVARRLSCSSAKTRRGGSRRILRSCQNYYAERDLAPSKVRGRTNTRMNLIAVTAKTAKTKRSPYSRRLSSTKLYSRPSRKKSAQSNAMTVLNTARRPLYSAAIKVTGKR